MDNSGFYQEKRVLVRSHKTKKKKTMVEDLSWWSGIDFAVFHFWLFSALKFPTWDEYIEYNNYFMLAKG